MAKQNFNAMALDNLINESLEETDNFKNELNSINQLGRFISRI